MGAALRVADAHAHTHAHVWFRAARDATVQHVPVSSMMPGIRGIFTSGGAKLAGRQYWRWDRRWQAEGLIGFNFFTDFDLRYRGNEAASEPVESSVEDRCLQITPGCGIALCMGLDNQGQRRSTGASMVVSRKDGRAKWTDFNALNDASTQRVAEFVGTRWMSHQWPRNGVWSPWSYTFDGRVYWHVPPHQMIQMMTY